MFRLSLSVCWPIFFLFPFCAQAQCVADIIQGDTLVVNCGDTVSLSTWSGTGVSALDNFNGGFADTVNFWTQTANPTFTNPCGPNPLSGSTYAWMGPSASLPRILQTQFFDLSCGANICFDLRMATQGDPAPCEGPDLTIEGIGLEYSLDGTNWDTLMYFAPDSGGLTGPYLTWGNHCVSFPGSLATSPVALRWRQGTSNTFGFDHWGIDSVSVVSNCNGGTLLWSTGDTGASTAINAITADSIVTLTRTFNGDTCHDTIVILVDSVHFTAQTSASTVCTGTSVQLDMDTANASGLNPGATYNAVWSPSTGLTNPNAFATSATVSSTTNYMATLTRQGHPSCTFTDMVSVSIGNPISLDSLSISPELCGNSQGGIANGQIEVFATGLAPLTYNFGNGPSGSSVAANLSAQNYTITLSDTLSGCVQDSVVTVPLDTGLTLNSLTATAVSCAGACDGLLSATVSGNQGIVNYTWGWTGQGGPGVNQATALCAQTVVVQIQDDFCLWIDTIDVDEPDSLVLIQSAVQNAPCSNEATGGASIMATGGTGPYQYNWPDLGLSSDQAINQLPGTYLAQVTDQNGCTAQVNTVIGFDFPAPVFDLGADTTICPDETVTLTAPMTATAVVWDDLSSGFSRTVMAPQTAICTLTDANGCSSSDTLEVHAFPFVAPTITIDSNASTVAPFLLDAGTGYLDYTWAGPNSLPNQQRVWASVSGLFTVTVVDSNGCTGVDSITMDLSTSLAESKLFAAVSLFPNPSDGQLTLALPGFNGKQLAIAVVNGQGQRVWEQQAVVKGSEQVELNLTHLAKGHYWVRLQSKGTTETFPLLLK